MFNSVKGLRAGVIAGGDGGRPARYFSDVRFTLIGSFSFFISRHFHIKWGLPD